MAIIIEKPRKTKEELKQFLNFINLSTSNLEWCKWAGWTDTDASIQVNMNKSRRKTPERQELVKLSLRDRQPVELLSNFFETNLLFHQHKTVTPEPYRYHYIAKQYVTRLYISRAVCFTKNVYPYLLNDVKKQYAVKLLGYEPESKPLDEWTKEEFVAYLATVIEGDGNVEIQKNKKIRNKVHINVRSSDAEYLSKLKYLVEKFFNAHTNLTEMSTYKTLDGIKTKYRLRIYENLDLYSLLTKPNVMTMDRKKNKIMEVFN